MSHDGSALATEDIKREVVIKDNEAMSITIKQEPPDAEGAHNETHVVPPRYIVKEELMIEFEPMDEPDLSTESVHNERPRKSLLSYYSKSYDTWVQTKSALIPRYIEYLPVRRPIRTYTKPKASAKYTQSIQNNDKTGLKLSTSSDSCKIQVKQTPNKEQQIGSLSNEPVTKNHFQAFPSSVFICNVCNEFFSSKILLKQHQDSHQNSTYIEEEDLTNDLKSQCDNYKKFTRSSCLKNHLRIHEGEKPFTCDICKKDFSQKCSLNEHMHFHRAKHYSCQMCNKQFKHRSTLSYHKSNTADSKMFMCNICKKEFTLKCLKYHLRTHRERNLIEPPEFS